MTETQGQAFLREAPLTQESYSPYGAVICERSDISPSNANLGTAKRFDFLTPLENLRPGQAKANLCLFRCNPMIKSPTQAFPVKVLERHKFSTQVFVPMNGVESYLVIVCLGENAPDLRTLRAFRATGAQGISYKPGVWHHPLVAINQFSEFACFVYEDGTAGDCELVSLEGGPTVELEKSAV